MRSAPELWTSAGAGAPVDAGYCAGAVEERLADRLSARQVGAGPQLRAVLLRRLRSYDRAAFRSVARLSTPLLDEPLRRVSDFGQILQAVVPRCWLPRAAWRPSGPARRAYGPRGRRRSVPGGDPAHEDGRRTPPPRPGLSRRPPAAMGAHAIIDIVPVRSLRVRRRLRRCRRRRPAGAPAAVADSRLDHCVLPRVHRRALSE